MVGEGGCYSTCFGYDGLERFVNSSESLLGPGISCFVWVHYSGKVFVADAGISNTVAASEL